MAEGRYGKWVYAVVAVPPIVALLTASLAPDPHGHWSEHLSSVGLKSAQLVLLVLLVTMLGWRKFSVLHLIAFVVVSAGIGLQGVGDYRVADAIWGTTGDPGFGSGYTLGHELAELGDLFVIIGGIAFALHAGAARLVPLRWAIAATVMVIIPPPFFWPGVGVLTLLLYWLTAKTRRTAVVAEDVAGPPG